MRRFIRRLRPFLTSLTLVPVLAIAAEGGREVELSLRDLGQYSTATLRGVDGALYLPFGVRLDELVTRAELKLHYAWSPALLPSLSHLAVRLNDEVVATLPLPREGAGREQTATLSLDPRRFTDYNQLQLRLIGHYTEQCEDPQHSSLWATLSASTSLHLQLTPLPPADDLGLLPAPFFDRRDPRRLELPLVWATAPDTAALEAAGIVASWFGALADYRSARFPVVVGGLPERHAVVFAPNDRRPPELGLEPVEKPTLSVRAHPRRPTVKLLVLQGRDTAQLRTAALALTQGQPVLSGAFATVESLVEPPRRAAYDAPRWLASDRPVRFGELVESPAELESRGSAPAPVRVNLRVPPDLFTWQQRGVPLDLRYRYTAPPVRDNSRLSVSINDEFVHAFPLPPDDRPANAGSLLVPLLEEGDAGLRDDLVIPAFQVGADNQLQFQFAFDRHKDGQCQGSPADSARGALDPDSTVDISGFPHYAALPNLALFANAGFPFTRHADLAETAVVLPDALDRESLEAALFLVGRFGRQTGAVATRLRWITASQIDAATDADLLVISGAGGASGGRDLLNDWADDLPAVLDARQRTLRPRPSAPWYRPSAWHLPAAAEAAGEVRVAAAKPMAGLLAFESPLRARRSVVALAATAPAAFEDALAALEDAARVPRLRGEAVLFQGNELSAQSGGARYHVGDLPTLTLLRLFLSQYPLLLVLFAVAASLVAAVGFSRRLRQQAQARLNPPGPAA